MNQSTTNLRELPTAVNPTTWVCTECKRPVVCATGRGRVEFREPTDHPDESVAFG